MVFYYLPNQAYARSVSMPLMAQAADKQADAGFCCILLWLNVCCKAKFPLKKKNGMLPQWPEHARIVNFVHLRAQTGLRPDRECGARLPG